MQSSDDFMTATASLGRYAREIMRVPTAIYEHNQRPKGKNVPCHDMEIHHPDGRLIVHRHWPVKKFKGRFHCKYCYSRHRSWWLMDQADYSLGKEPNEDWVMILCARCGYTSRSDFAT
jgi:hypothetical protein